MFDLITLLDFIKTSESWLILRTVYWTIKPEQKIHNYLISALSSNILITEDLFDWFLRFTYLIFLSISLSTFMAHVNQFFAMIYYDCVSEHGLKKRDVLVSKLSMIRISHISFITKSFESKRSSKIFQNI